MRPTRSHPRDARHPGGFTMLEVMIVVIIGAVLLSAVMPAWGRMQVRWAVQNARDSFILLSARARATALERGIVTALEVDPETDRAWVVTSDGDTIDMADYTREEHRADVTTGSGGALTVCYTGRGIAHETCTTNGLPTTVTFSTAGQDAVAVVQPLGQVEHQ